MRIHLSLDPKHLEQPVAGPSSGPLVNIGGDLVLIELQGELNHEGDKADGVVGILGLDRPDKPTLHLGEHHLLHGKMANLAKPYAVIRRALAEDEGAAGAVEGDAEEEDDIDDAADASKAKRTPVQQRPKGKAKSGEEERDEDEEEEGPLFEPDPDGPLFFETPRKDGQHPSSSPASTVYPSSAIKDYSSELDFSSPPVSVTSSKPDEDAADEHDGSPVNRKKRKAATGRDGKQDKKQRTRRYEVVGVVRKKVVFALRPEPIVTATILPD